MKQVAVPGVAAIIRQGVPTSAPASCTRVNPHHQSRTQAQWSTLYGVVAKHLPHHRQEAIMRVEVTTGVHAPPSAEVVPIPVIAIGITYTEVALLTSEPRPPSA
jgi:hypothetical protein